MKKIFVLTKTFLLVLFITLLPLTLSAQDCEQVLKDGVFNTTSITSNTHLSKSFYQYIYQADFSTHQQAIDAGISIGTIVYGVPVQLGGTFSKQQKDQWRSTHQEFKDETTNLSQKYSALIKFASPDILESWTKCIDIIHSSRVGLYGWIEEVNATSAILHVTWIPMAGDGGRSPKVLSSSIRGGARSDNSQMVAFPQNYQIMQGANGNMISLTRKVNEAMVVIVSTSRGDVSCVLQAPPKPRIISFTASPEQVQIGNSSTLVWSVSKADRVSIDNGIGDIPANSSRQVTPSTTTSYVLTATNSSGSITSQTTVTVNIPPPPSISTVRVTIHTEDDDKDQEEAVEIWIYSTGTEELAHGIFGSGEKWDDQSDKSFSFNLSRSILCSEGIRVRVYKHPHGSRTGNGWHMSLEASGACSDGNNRVLKTRSGTTNMGDGDDNPWDRTW